jgi:uncharacterized protein (DUF1499 family)
VSGSSTGSPSGKRFAPCPSSPNCVSSQSHDADHFIDPIAFQGSLKEAQARFKQVLSSLPRTRIVEEEPGYLRAESTSLIFRFTDDLECVFDDTLKVIHVRSASRIGYSDLGANRKRVEAIRQHFHRHQSPTNP